MSRSPMWVAGRGRSPSAAAAAVAAPTSLEKCQVWAGVNGLIRSARERASKAALRSWERERWMKTERERQLRLAGTVRKQSAEGERGCEGGR